jgi:hypothetical protein
MKDARPCMRCMSRYEMHRCEGEGGARWFTHRVVVWWHDGMMAGGVAEPRPAGRANEGPRGLRRDWPDPVIGGSPRGRNRVMGGLGDRPCDRGDRG